LQFVLNTIKGRIDIRFGSWTNRYASEIQTKKSSGGIDKMGRTDILVGTIMLIFSSIAYILTLQFPGSESVSSGLGPAFFPKLVLFCMLILGCAILVSGFLTLKQNITLDLKIVDMGSSVLLLVFTGGYIFLMNFFGFFIATPIFLIGSMIIWRVKWHRALMIGIGLTCVLYVFIKIILRIPLPRPIIFGGF
jgi:hypothetical protein